MPTGTGRIQRATNIVRAAVGIGRNAEARRQGFRAGDERVRERDLNRAAADSEHGAQMRWPTSQATGDGMRRYMADRGRSQRAAANRSGASASRSASRSRRAAGRS